MKLKYIILLLFVLSKPIIATTFFLDPINGKLSNSGSALEPWSSLSEIINANYIVTQEYYPLPYTSNSQLRQKNVGGFVHAGDTLILKEGLHGNIFLRNYINEIPITVIAEEGNVAILEKVKLQACKNWIFEGVHISSEPYGYYLNNCLAYIECHSWHGPSSNITIKNCDIYSSLQPWSLAEDWLNNVSDGLFINGDSCRAVGNRIFNVDMGLTCFGDYIIAEDNEIANFSGDGGRILGSYISFNYNIIKNNYDVDDNHDDGIQSFPLNGNKVDNNEVIGNLIINTNDTTRPLNGPLQGIACFDGFYNDWLVANNVVSVNHWHGITFLGANRCTLIHNTVIDPTPNITPGGSWIKIGNHKDGTPSSDCLVANNVANNFYIDGVNINNIILDSQSLYLKHFTDYINFDFRLKPISTLINAADSNYSITTDYERKIRDTNPDIGAIEYSNIATFISEQKVIDEVIIYPNPFDNKVIISNLSESNLIHLYNTRGNLLLKGSLNQINDNIESLNSGIYYFMIYDNNNINVVRAVKI